MQSLFRRTQRAVTQRQRESQKNAKGLQVLKKVQAVQVLQDRAKFFREKVEESRKRRWEEWYMGPLAPKKVEDEEMLDKAKKREERFEVLKLQPPRGYVRNVKGNYVRKQSIKAVKGKGKVSASSLSWHEPPMREAEDSVCTVGSEGTRRKRAMNGAVLLILYLQQKDQDAAPARKPFTFKVRRASCSLLLYERGFLWLMTGAGG